MHTNKHHSLGFHLRRACVFTLFGASIAGLPALLTACDDTVSHDKSTTVKTVESPNKTTKTTTTTEKKVEETPKP